MINLKSAVSRVCLSSDSSSIVGSSSSANIEWSLRIRALRKHRKHSTLHAEANAFLHSDYSSRPTKIYVNGPPCFSCAKLIANSTVEKIYYIKDDNYLDWEKVKNFLVQNSKAIFKREFSNIMLVLLTLIHLIIFPIFEIRYFVVNNCLLLINSYSILSSKLNSIDESL